MNLGLKNRIVLIDDSSSEPVLLSSAIEKSGKNVVLESFDDSIEAVKEIKRRSIEDEESLPNLILLDLNMPGYNGLDVLKILRDDARLKFIPIVIMTSSTLDSDTKDSLSAGANSVIVKPSGHEKYVEVVKMVYDYWFHTVKRLDSGFF